MKKKLATSLLAGTLVLAQAAPAFAAGDTAGHWAQDALNTWQNYGVIKGDQNGNLMPDSGITRGEMAVMLDRVMAYQLKAQNTFTDLDQSWYTDAILGANAAGIIMGMGDGTVQPGASITRQETAVMFARVLNLDTQSAPDAGFQDQASIPDWAVGAVNAMAAAGYMQGSNGLFRPADTITRAEVVTILDNIFNANYNASGEYTGDVDGSAVISADAVTLKDMHITGDLIVAEGVGQGHVELNNVTVDGRLLVRGGGANSIVIKGDSKIGQIIVSRQEGKVRVAVEDDAQVSVVIVDQGTDSVKLEGDLGTVSVEGAGAAVEISGQVDTVSITETAVDATVTVNKDAAVSTVTTAAENATLTVAGKVESVTVDESADGTAIKTESGAKIDSVITSGSNTTVEGAGTVSNVEAQNGATGTTVTTTGTKVENNSAESVTTGNGSVEAGDTAVTTKPSTGGSTGGGSTGGTVDYAAQAKEALKNAVQNAYQYKYEDGYTYADVYSVKLDGDAAVISGVFSMTQFGDGTVAMNDAARYLGALYRRDNGASVTGIVYNGTAYTWNAQGTLKGSNWQDSEGNTLVSAIVSDFQSKGAVGALTIKGNYDTSVTLTLALEVTANTEAELKAMLASGMSTVKLGASFEASGKITVSRPVTIDGNGMTITAAEGWTGSTNSDKHLLGIESDDVTVKNLTLNSSSKAYGLQAYCAADVTLENVTLQGSVGAGLTVNSSSVTATGLHTSGNAWGGVNIDMNVPDHATVLTFDATSTFGETAGVYSDNGGVTVNAPEGYACVQNGGKYYWSQLFAGGYGTAEAPYQVATAAQLSKLVSGSDSQHLVYYVLNNDLDLKDSVDSGVELVQNIVFDGGSHKISSSSAGTALYGVFRTVRGTTEIRNLTYDLTNLDSKPWSADLVPLIYNAEGTSADIKITNVRIEGSHSIDSNNAPFVMNEALVNSTLTLTGCEMAASLSGDGYNACFIGWQLPKYGAETCNTKIVLDGCTVSGELSCPRASIVTANGSNAAARTYEYKGDNTLTGTVRGTLVAKYFTAVSETDKTAFEDAAKAGFTVTGGQLYVDVKDDNLAISIEEDTGKLVVTPSQDEKVASYEVRIGLYTHFYTAQGAEGGTWKFFASQTVDAADLDSLALYNYQFVDAAYDGLGELTKDAAGNDIAQLDGKTCYVVKDYTYPGDPDLTGYVGSPTEPGLRSATIIQVTAYDANGDILYTSSLKG